MTMKKFIADSKMFEYDKHYRECQQNNQPFIKARINPINGNYNAQIDLMTCDYNLTLNGQNQMKEFFESEIAFLKLDSHLESCFKGYSVNKELLWFDGVLPTRLIYFCEKLYELSQMYHD